MRKVLHVFKDYYPPTRGGVEEHINDIVHGVEGYDFAVLTSSRARKTLVEDDDGVRVVRAPELFRPMSTPVTPAWRKMLRESGADIFHFHTPNPFGELMLLSARSRTPLVVTYHADIVGRRALAPLFAPFQKKFLSKARAIVVSNPRLPESSPTLRSFKDRCSVVPFGVDPQLWAPRPAFADDIARDHPGHRIVFVGRLAYYKGVDVLIKAMRSVDATLFIAGDGPLRGTLERLAVEARVARKVHFLGAVTDVMRHCYLHAADLFVLPATSRAETFGIAMLQAMACGTPVISTEVGTGTSWLNLNQKTGLVVPAADPDALAGAIKTLLSDQQRLEEMSLSCLRRVEESFSKQAMLEGVRAVYDSVLK